MLIKPCATTAFNQMILHLCTGSRNKPPNHEPQAKKILPEVEMNMMIWSCATTVFKQKMWQFWRGSPNLPLNHEPQAQTIPPEVPFIKALNLHDPSVCVSLSDSGTDAFRFCGGGPGATRISNPDQCSGFSGQSRTLHWVVCIKRDN